jgi:hypothetical protein
MTHPHILAGGKCDFGGGGGRGKYGFLTYRITSAVLYLFYSKYHRYLGKGGHPLFFT